MWACLRDATMPCAALAAWVFVFLIMCASSKMHLHSVMQLQQGL